VGVIGRLLASEHLLLVCTQGGEEVGVVWAAYEIYGEHHSLRVKAFCYYVIIVSSSKLYLLLEAEACAPEGSEDILVI